MNVYSRQSFDCSSVHNAVNPWNGVYFHGPIPNNNEGWRPPNWPAFDPENPNAPMPPVTTGDNVNPPNLAVRMSAINGAVCHVSLDATTMCGVVFRDQPSLRRHIRAKHPGAVANPPTRNTSLTERLAGTNALKLFVLSGGWRDASYLYEPGTGGLPISDMATACERIASEDPDFATRFGTRFHRPGELLAAAPTGKRKHGPVPDEPPSGTGSATSSQPGGSSNKRRRSPTAHVKEETPTRRPRGRPPKTKGASLP